jgi:hypothetical protein
LPEYLYYLTTHDLFLARSFYRTIGMEIFIRLVRLSAGVPWDRTNATSVRVSGGQVAVKLQGVRTDRQYTTEPVGDRIAQIVAEIVIKSLLALGATREDIATAIAGK